MSQSHKLASFEGLRGLAAVVVVFYHLRLAFYADRVRLPFLPHLLQRPFESVLGGLMNGSFAVWLFWIMSGFVLSLQFFLRARQTGTSAAHDYLEDASLRRYPRLVVPVLASVLFAWLLLRCGLMANVEMAERLGHPDFSQWLISWYRFPADLHVAVRSAVWDTFVVYYPGSTYNNVLWTMEEEFFGSFYLFAFLALLGHRRSRFVAYPILAICNHKLNFEWLNAFVGGIALCDLFANRDRYPWLQRFTRHSFLRTHPVLPAVLWFFFLMGVGFANYRGLSYLVLGLGAVALTLLSGPAQRVLSSPVPMFLGRISFGLYLVHIPIIFSFTCHAYLAGWSPLAASAATCVLSIAGGYLLYLVADKPAIRWSRALSLWITQSATARPAVTAGAG